NTDAVRPMAVAGLPRSRRVRPAKCTSPANATVNRPGEVAAGEGRAATGVVAGETGAAGTERALGRGAETRLPQAAARQLATAAQVTAAGRRVTCPGYGWA